MLTMANIDLEKIRDKLFEKRFFFINDDINRKQSEELFQAVFMLCMDKKEEINFIFKTNGGMVRHGLHIYDHIASLPVPTVGWVPDRASSSGIYGLAACTRRIGMPHSEFLFHSMKSELTLMLPHPGDLSIEDQIKNDVENFKILRENVSKVLLSRLKITAEELENLQKIGERENQPIMSPKALEIGLLTEIWDGTQENWFWQKLMS